MSKKKKTIIGIIVFVLFLGISFFAYSNLANHYKPTAETPNENQSPKQEETKTLAPDFTVYDAKGNKVNLSDYRGKPVVLNFWASWCPPCKGEMPHFNEVYVSAKDNVVFMMIDLVDGERETKEKGQQYVKNMGYTFPVCFDLEQQAAYTYGISSIPTTFFIDFNGYIVKAYQGAIDKGTLQDGINSLKK